MKQVTFFTEPEWAFGVIHYELVKHLFVHDVNATVLPWNKQYTAQEIAELAAVVEAFVSTPYGVAILIDRVMVCRQKSALQWCMLCWTLNV